MILVQAKAGEFVPENVQGAQGVGNNVKSMVASIQSRVPAIDIGEVKSYKEEGHLATLKHGQTVAAGDVSPSIRVKVNDVAPLHEKPIASPFAWQKCGLIVPVYQGMRAVLAHNLGIVNDAIVTGFIWPDEPKYERPKNKPGDYWLCLPTKVENGQPTGKGVNDLTDASGLRVIQSKGLHVFVGDDQLPDVGARPAVPDAKTIVIEHESGTKITITDNGALKIEAAQGKDITMTSGDSSITVGGDGTLQIKAAQGKDITMTNGGVTLKLDSSGVKIS
jgi:hypothetical protein